MFPKRRRLRLWRMPECLTFSDAPLLAAIHAAAFAKPWTQSEFERLLRSPGVGGWRAGENAFLLIRSVADEMEILTLATVPSVRRRGLARGLMQELQKALETYEVKRCFLEVNASNQAALALYRHFNFSEISRRKAYYQMPGGYEDAIVMAC